MITQFRVGDVSFVASSPSDAVDRELARALNSDGGHVHFANAWSVVVARDSEDMRNALSDGTCYPDGLPVAWAMRASDVGRRATISRVKGPEFFEKAVARGRDLGVRHFLFGGTPETLARLERELLLRYPGALIVGRIAPPFGPVSSNFVSEHLESIRAQHPHIVWVGLGTPKQDIFASLAATYPGPLYACVGAAFDMVAGNVRIAPAWMSRVGLEWAYRFAQEPRRLWRRYTYGNAKYCLIALRSVRINRLRAR